MAELVQGVKLKYELGGSLPKPVSFPFESIGDYRPVSQIPKYDFTLEKQIMKEIAKQKQTEQYNALKQAQQQLTMVDIIASRKNRRKGKEPDRSSSAAAGATNASLQASLARPSSDTGVLRPRQDHGASATTNQAEMSVIKPSSNPAAAAALSQGGASASEAATGEAPSSGVGGLDVRPGRTHQTVPASTNAPASEQEGKTPAVYPPVQTQQPAPATNVAAAGTYGPQKVNMQYMQQPPQHQQQQLQLQQQQQHIRSQIQGMHHQPNAISALQQQNANNGPLGFVIPPQAANQQHARPVVSLPQALPASTGTARPAAIFSTFQQQQQQQQGMQQPVAQASSAALPQQLAARPAHHPYAPAPPVFSSSLPSWQSATPQKETSAPVQPALPPKPEEWKVRPHGSGAHAASASPSNLPTSTYSSSAPALPARNQNLRQQQSPAPPAIPPKPFMAFSEFDYASDDVSGLGSSSQTGHVEQLNTLLSMGFGRPQAIHALEMYDYDVNKASNYLIDKAFH